MLALPPAARPAQPHCPGVGTTVPGEPTYREAQRCMEMIADTGLLASLDVVALNPAFDVRNRTAELKSTLMRKN